MYPAHISRPRVAAPTLPADAASRRRDGDSVLGAQMRAARCAVSRAHEPACVPVRPHPDAPSAGAQPPAASTVTASLSPSECFAATFLREWGRQHVGERDYAPVQRLLAQQLRPIEARDYLNYRRFHPSLEQLPPLDALIETAYLAPQALTGELEQLVQRVLHAPGVLEPDVYRAVFIDPIRRNADLCRTLRHSLFSISAFGWHGYPYLCTFTVPYRLGSADSSEILDRLEYFDAQLSETFPTADSALPAWQSEPIDRNSVRLDLHIVFGSLSELECLLFSMVKPLAHMATSASPVERGIALAFWFKACTVLRAHPILRMSNEAIDHLTRRHLPLAFHAAHYARIVQDDAAPALPFATSRNA